MKTGTSMGGIITTKKAKITKLIKIKKSTARKKRANICIKCNYNNEGYCNKHKSWCGKVNYICLGIEDPYEYKPKNQIKSTKKDKKLMKKYEENSEKMKKQLMKKYKIKED